MQTFILERDGMPKLGFFGEQIVYAKVRWREAFVFRTQGGSHVVYTIKIAGGLTKKRGTVIDALADVVDILGQSIIAKRVYGLLGIANTRNVE